MEIDTFQSNEIGGMPPGPRHEPNSGKKKHKFLKIWLPLIILVLLAAAAGGYYLWKQQDKKPAASTVQKTGKPAQTHYERIAGLSSAPADFQAFIKKEFDAKSAACNQRASKDQLSMTVYKIVRGSYASVAEDCGSVSAVFYAKTDGAWMRAFTAQGAPACDPVNNYKMPKELIGQCYDAKGDLVDNPNT